jgi:hypothetical protein
MARKFYKNNSETNKFFFLIDSLIYFNFCFKYRYVAAEGTSAQTVLQFGPGFTKMMRLLSAAEIVYVVKFYQFFYVRTT